MWDRIIVCDDADTMYLSHRRSYRLQVFDKVIVSVWREFDAIISLSNRRMSAEEKKHLRKSDNIILISTEAESNLRLFLLCYLFHFKWVSQLLYRRDIVKRHRVWQRRRMWIFVVKTILFLLFQTANSYY